MANTLTEEHLESKIQYNREYMRRKRSDPVQAELLRTESRRYARRRRATDADYNARELERLKAWQEANPKKMKERHKLSKQRREHRKQQLPATLTIKDWEHALEYFERTCAYCGMPTDELHQEHFIPVAKGGGYTKDNIIPSCPECNSDKRAKEPLDWLIMQNHGLLTYTKVAEYLAKGVKQ